MYIHYTLDTYSHDFQPLLLSQDWDKEISSDDEDELNNNYDDTSLSGGKGGGKEVEVSEKKKRGMNRKRHRV